MTLNGTDIEWVSEIKHLRNNLDKSCNDKHDCQIKVLHFIAGQKRRLGSVYFNKVCTAWNIAVRKKYAACHIPRIDGF